MELTSNPHSFLQYPKTVHQESKHKPTGVIYVFINDTHGMSLNHDFFYRLFSNFGEIKRVLILENNQICKVLIEFISVESAIEAGKILDNANLLNDIGKMTVMYTNLETLKGYKPENNSNFQLKDYIKNEKFSQHKSLNSVPDKPSSKTSSTIKVNSAKSIDPLDHEDFDILKIISNQETLSELGSIEHESNLVLDELDEQILMSNFDDKLFIGNTGKSSMSDIKDDNETHQFKSKTSVNFSSHINNQQFNYNHQDANNGSKEPKIQNQRNILDMMDKSISSSLASSAEKTIRILSDFGSQQAYSKKQSSKYSSMTDAKLDPEPGMISNFNEETGSLNYNGIGMTPQSGSKLFNPQNLQMQSFNISNTQQQKTPSCNNLDNPQLYSHNRPKCFSHQDLDELSSSNNSKNKKFITSPKIMQLFNNNNNNGLNNLNQSMNIGKVQINPVMNNCIGINFPESYQLNHQQQQQHQSQVQLPLKLQFLQQQQQDQSQLQHSINSNLNIQSMNMNLNKFQNTTPKIAPINQYNTLTNLSNIAEIFQVNKNVHLYQNFSNVLNDELNKSTTIYVKGLESEEIKISMIYNIFSNFGNILKIIYIRKKCGAYIEYENDYYSTTAKDYLNNISFMGKALRIYYSNQNIMSIKKTLKDINNDDIFIGNIKSFRFKKNKNISINPPSSTLHISNLIKDICYEDFMRNLFSPYGKVEAIKFLLMENSKNMCLVKMSTLEESINSIAYLHDVDIGGRKIQISFTRSKI